jgi:hypothetical protein
MTYMLWRDRVLQRVVGALVTAAMLLPVLAGCATAPAPKTPVLAGIVVDGVRAARAEDRGLVRIGRDGTWLEGRPGMALRIGDRVETGPTADAVIRWPGGSELFMRPNSGGRVGSFSDTVGEVFAKIKGLFTVETTFVRAGARGTAFLVRTAAGGATTVIVFEGRVSVDSTSGAWQAVEIGAGTMVLAHPRAPRPMPAPPDELARTREWVERVERLLPPAETGGSGRTAAAALTVAAMVALLLAGGKDKPDEAARPQREPQRDPAPPVPTAAPSGLQPGSANPAAPALLSCANRVALGWAPVAGVQDYLLTLETLPPNARSWRGVANPAVAGTRWDTAAGLDGLFRWWVQARNAAGSGPASAVLYFRCTPHVLR